MDELNNVGQNNAQENKISVDEQISNLERSINGNVETQLNPIDREEQDNNVEKDFPTDGEPKKCRCNSGVVFGICGLILGLAALVLFFLMYKGILPEQSNKPENDAVAIIPTHQIDTANNEIAYIDLDSLLLTYNYAIKLQEDLAMEQKKAEGTIQTRMTKFENMYNAYAEKARTGMFISAASQQAQQNELEKEQRAIESLQASLTNQLLEKQGQMNQEIYDTVTNFITEYCADKYKVVLGNMNGLNVVYAQPGMNITTVIVDLLNQRYGGTPTSTTDVEKKQ